MRALPLLFAILVERPVSAADEVVPFNGRIELVFTAESDAAPDAEVTLELERPSGRPVALPAFWDGGRVWRARVRAIETGTWKYKARAEPRVPGISGKSGSFVCKVLPSGNRFVQHGPIRVAKSGTYLEHGDGTPFFFLGDTVWSGPALSSKADWEVYLKDRVGKHFTAIQFVTLNGWRCVPADAEGRVAFSGARDVKINPEYFKRLDERIAAISDAGLLAAPVLLWANRQADHGYALPEADLIRLARYQVARYGAYDVLWILAGDNSYRGSEIEKWKRIGRAVFGDRPVGPVTTHPTGTNWPWEDWRGEEWLTVFGYQSGHGDDARTMQWLHSGPVKEHWAKNPARPIINLEPPYEGHNGYSSRKPHSANSVRRAVWWSVLSAPTAGVTYGGHGLWSWQTEVGKEPLDHKGTGIAATWDKALALPGSNDMRTLAEFFSQIEWWRLRPADDTLVRPAKVDAAGFVASARSETGDLAVIYAPRASKFEVDPRRLAADLKARWFNPRSGAYKPAHAEKGPFETPGEGDWVLLLSQ